VRIIKKIFKSYARRLGYDISRIYDESVSMINEGNSYLKLKDKYSSELNLKKIKKAHYGCGIHHFENDWVNIDRYPTSTKNNSHYMRADLTSKHPFPSNYFHYAFAEDFLEHLSQDVSIIFLSEVFRCLKAGGVLRLSFPGLRGILQKHYRSSNYVGAAIGRKEAYTIWEHKHFYCEESLSIVAEHIGFSNIRFVQYGVSDYEALKNLDHREDQKGLNIYTELTK
jgi:predicted SAM-dependent methyltransferase